MNEKTFKLFSLGSREKNKLSSDTLLSNWFKEEVTKIPKNCSFSYLWQPSKSKFSWRNESESSLAFPASSDVLKKVWGRLVHSPEQFFWEAFLRSSVPWAAAIALTRPPNKTLKVSLFGYLISSRIILDLNNLLSEELKRYDAYFIKLIDMNCKCLLDFVNPALPSWSDEFGITCDHTNILCHVFLLKSVISSHNSCVGKIWAKLGPMLWKVRKQALSISFFSYFTWGIPIKGKRSGCTNPWVEI